MALENFGRRLTFEEAKPYFKRYLDLKAKWGEGLRAFLKNDPDAQRFLCGRQGQDPAQEDWAYVFDRESFARLRKLFDDTGADSMVIFQGIRNLQEGDPAGESNGRPTLLVFPATFEADKDDASRGTFLIATAGEEHPGSGGGTGKEVIPSLPDRLETIQIHKML